MDSIKDTEHVFYCTNNGSITNSTHDATLQSLNQWVGDYYYNATAFKAEDWNGIPVIYQEDGVHPNCVEVSADIYNAIKKINGKLVGTIQNSKIEVNGHPRLFGQLSITDEETEGLIKSKILSLSTGMFGKDTDRNLQSTRPNHVLLFKEGKNPMGIATPVDAGSIIYNSTLKPYGNVEYADTGYQEDKINRYPIDTEEHVGAALSYINMPKNAEKYSPEQLKTIKSKIESAAKKYGIQIKNSEMHSMAEPTQTPESKITIEETTVIKNSIMKEIEDKMAEDTKITEAEKQVQILNSQLAAKATETAALEARIKAFETEKEVQIKNTRNDQWKQIKNSLAPGLTHEPTKEQELQAKFLGDPFAFSVFLASQIKPVTTPEDGIEHPILNTSDQDKPGPGAQLGVYDPATRSWK